MNIKPLSNEYFILKRLYEEKTSKSVLNQYCQLQNQDLEGFDEILICMQNDNLISIKHELNFDRVFYEITGFGRNVAQSLFNEIKEEHKDLFG